MAARAGSTNLRIFTNREEAGRALVERLRHLGGPDVVVLGLPRGGVPVAAVVAEALDAPLDVIVVRKLGVPFQPELGMGAIGEEGARVLNADVVAAARVSTAELEAVEARERAEVERRAGRFRGGRAPLPLAGRTAVVVDDGIATGGTARAALQVARARGARRTVLAVPVAPADAVARFATVADEVVVVEAPDDLWAVGAWYRDFHQVPDEDVVDLLDVARRRMAAAAPDRGESGSLEVDDVEVDVDAAGVTVGGTLSVPSTASAIVLFAHGSGSSRHSPRNRSVAAALNRAGLATLLFDLLTPQEALDRRAVFDVDLLAERLVGATRWVRAQPSIAALPIGYFGASTGAAAALVGAATAGVDVYAVVSRGGRPDLATNHLGDVHAPVLLVVGGHDTVVLDLNREAARRLGGPHELDIVPGATHLFEEPGALEAVADVAARWFTRHLPGRSAS